MNAKTIADKYISRGGGAPQSTSSERASDLLDVARYLLWQEDGSLWGCVRKEEAVAAFCRLVNVEPYVLDRIVKGDKNSGL